MGIDDALKELSKRLNSNKNNSVKNEEFDSIATEVALEYNVDVNQLVTAYTNSLSELGIRNFVKSVILESNSYIKDKLNPEIWNYKDNNYSLKPDVHEHCLKVADSFENDLRKVFPDIEIEDIKLVGSNANYNYTPMSDIDIHLVVDYSKLNDSKELLDGYFNAARMLYNFNHNIKIKGYDAEVYVEDSTIQPQSSGVYSILNDKWIVVPTKDTIDIDDDIVEMKYQSLKNEISYLIENASDKDYAISYYKKLFDMRKSALAASGEFSIENLAFKRLRNDGLIDKLRNYINDLNNRNLSLESQK